MRHAIFVALCLLATAACVAEPLDGRKLTSHRDRVRFAGYYPSAGTEIIIETYNAASGTWTFSQTVTTQNAPTADASGRQWYWFEAWVQLPSAGSYWGASVESGMRAARVRARDGNVNLAMFRTDADGLHNTDLSSCAADQGWDGLSIYLNCRSGSVAQINAPCGDTSELCCSTGNSCNGDNTCRYDHCVAPGAFELTNLGLWPVNGERDWVSDGLQGVATDGNSWFFSTTHHIYRVKQNGLDEATPEWTMTNLPSSLPSGVNHLGGMDFHDGLLWVAFENEDDPNKTPKGIAVFDAQLNYVSHAVIGPGSNTAWVAINPIDGRLYTAATFSNVNSVKAYDIVWSSSGKLSLSFHHHLHLATTVPNIQGGDFAANGNLYLATDGDPGQLWIFDAAGGLRTVRALATESGDEIEGLVIWDTDAPNSGFDSQHANRGQVHVIRRDQEWVTGDELDLYHFRTTDTM